MRRAPHPLRQPHPRQPVGDPPAVHGQGAVPAQGVALAAGCVRPRRLSVPVLRRPRRFDRSRDAAFTGRPARVGERGGGLPALQPGQTRPHTRTRPGCACCGRAGCRGPRRGSSSAPRACPRHGSRTWRWHPELGPGVVTRVSGSAADFHARELPAVAAVWQFDVEHPAIVLGSRQTDDVLDVAACRRTAGRDRAPSLGRRRRVARARCDGVDRRRRARCRPAMGGRRAAVDGADGRTMGRGAAMVSSTAS